MKKYTTILFDADETLMDFRLAENLALQDVFEKNGLPTDEEFLSKYHEINNSLWEQYNRGEIEKKVITSSRFTNLFAHFNIPLDGADFNEKYIDQLSLHGDLLPGALELCRDLFQSGYSMYIITNGIGRVQTSRFAVSGLSPYFKAVFISEEIGIGKPHKEYFDYVLSQIPGVRPEEVLVVGDSLSADVAGGIAAGLDTCWVDFKGTKLSTKAQYRVENFDELRGLLLGEKDHD